MTDYLVDTNVALRTISTNDQRYSECVAATTILDHRGNKLVISAQVAVEIWNVITRPLDALPPGTYGLNTTDADVWLNLLEKRFEVLPDPPTLYQTWRKLVVEHAVVGAKVHDARHAAWTLAHGIDHILTYNGRDFARFTGITAVSPADVT